MNTIKHVTRHFVHSVLLSPPSIRYCSQTIYESLMGCCRLWEVTHDIRWRDRADRLLEILLSIQQPDGGFDIGYDFNFGRLHKKGQSTSPELVGLLAYCDYYRLFGNERAKNGAHRSVAWILKHTINVGERKKAIPYSPHTIREVMIYNGTSFACGALGYYLGQFGGNEELDTVYREMLVYLDSVMVRDTDYQGRYWPYCDQSRSDWDMIRRTKIDYYHQMQQVEMHALAQQVYPDAIQRKIIQDAADHILSLSRHYSIIPYTNNPNLFKGQLHLWGLVSVISGMLEAALVVPERAQHYRDLAKSLLEWILDNAWNGKHFYAILEQDGSPVNPQLYMVRSDAWVFNALAAAVKYIGNGPWYDLAEQCYLKMECVDFSGPESHAFDMRRRLVLSVWRRIKNVIGRT